MSSIMTSRQAAELDHAFERNGWTAEDVKRLSGGNLLKRLAPVVQGMRKFIVTARTTFLRKVRIAAQPSLITSEKYFTEAGVGAMSPSFQELFLELEVAKVPPTELAVHLCEDLLIFYDEVFARLSAKAVITVSQFREFLMKDLEEENYLFYLMGKDGQVWAVYARSTADGLGVQANPSGHWDLFALSPDSNMGLEGRVRIVSRS